MVFTSWIESLFSSFGSMIQRTLEFFLSRFGTTLRAYPRSAKEIEMKLTRKEFDSCWNPFVLQELVNPNRVFFRDDSIFDSMKEGDRGVEARVDFRMGPKRIPLTTPNVQ